MENLSKALLMAGGMLIGILIASLFIYEMLYFSGHAKTFHLEAEKVRVTEFNSAFEKYSHKSEITVHDVVSISNYIRQWNLDNPLAQITSTGTVLEADVQEFLKDNQKKYVCKLEYSSEDGRVNKVKITEKI